MTTGQKALTSTLGLEGSHGCHMIPLSSPEQNVGSVGGKAPSNLSPSTMRQGDVTGSQKALQETKTVSCLPRPVCKSLLWVFF